MRSSELISIRLPKMQRDVLSWDSVLRDALTQRRDLRDATILACGDVALPLPVLVDQRQQDPHPSTFYEAFTVNHGKLLSNTRRLLLSTRPGKHNLITTPHSILCPLPFLRPSFGEKSRAQTMLWCTSGHSLRPRRVIAWTWLRRSRPSTSSRLPPSSSWSTWRSLGGPSPP